IEKAFNDDMVTEWLDNGMEDIEDTKEYRMLGMIKENINVNVKILVAGDTNVGKTSLIRRTLYNTFDSKHVNTESHVIAEKLLGSAFQYIPPGYEDDFECTCGYHCKDKFKCPSKMYYEYTYICPNLQLLDLSCLDRDTFLLPDHFNESMAAVVIIDFTNETTFEGGKKWIELIVSKFHIDESYPILLCFNKIDDLSDSTTKTIIDYMIEKFLQECHELFPTVKFITTKCSVKNCIQITSNKIAYTLHPYTTFNRMWLDLVQEIPTNLLLN